MLDYKVSANCIKLIDSYTIHKRSEMAIILNWIKDKYPDNAVFKQRTINSLIREWRSHNLLYSLHIERDRTKDVDLNIGQKWYYKVCYFILSIFYL